MPASSADSTDVTYICAGPAEVTQLLSAVNRASRPPLRSAWEIGAQKCEREPGSLNVSVASISPPARADTSDGIPFGGAAATVIVPLMCIR